MDSDLAAPAIGAAEALPGRAPSSYVDSWIAPTVGSAFGRLKIQRGKFSRPRPRRLGLGPLAAVVGEASLGVRVVCGVGGGWGERRRGEYRSRALSRARSIKAGS